MNPYDVGKVVPHSDLSSSPDSHNVYHQVEKYASQKSEKMLVKSNSEHIFRFVSAARIKRKSMSQVSAQNEPSLDATSPFLNKVQPLRPKRDDNVNEIQVDKRIKASSRDGHDSVLVKEKELNLIESLANSNISVLMSSTAPPLAGEMQKNEGVERTEHPAGSITLVPDQLSEPNQKPISLQLNNNTSYNNNNLSTKAQDPWCAVESPGSRDGDGELQDDGDDRTIQLQEDADDDDEAQSNSKYQDIQWAQLYESSIDDERHVVRPMAGEEQGLVLAEGELTQKLEASISQLGRHDHRIIPLILALVPLRVDLKDFGSAEVLYREGLELVDTVRDQQQRLLWRQELRVGLCTLLTWQERYREAEMLARRIVIDFEHPSYLGTDNVQTLLAVRDLALLLTSQSKHTAAAEQYERLMAAYDRWLGPDHPYATSAANDLAVQLIRRRKLSRANALLERVISSREKALGADHPDTLSALANLGVLRHIEGCIADANTLYQRVLRGMGVDIEAGEQIQLPACACKVALNMAKLLSEEGDTVTAKKLRNDARKVALTSAKNSPCAQKEVISGGTSAPLPSFPRKGVTLRFVQKVRDYVQRLEEAQLGDQQRRGLPANNVRWTTTDVCNRLIKPWTETKKCSFDDLMRYNHMASLPPSSEVRKSYDTCFGDLSYTESFGNEAHIFVSHAWAYYCCEFVQAIETYFVDRLLNGGGALPEARASIGDSDDLADPNSTLLWIDLFVNDQWNAPSLPYEWWSGTFLSAIKDIGHTMLILSPWDAPIPLTRAWCLWEILSTIRSGARLTVQLSSTQRRSFQAKLREDYEYLMTAFCRIDVKNSQAWKEEDRDMIFKAVERYKGGFGGVNNMIMEKLRDWVEMSARMIVNDGRTISDCESAGSNSQLDHCRDKVSIASVLHIQNKLAEAEAKYKEAIADMKKLPCSSPTDYFVLTTMSKLASLYRQQNKTTEATRIYYQVLEGFRRTLGDDHLDTLRTCSSLASLIRKERNYGQALELYNSLLEGFQRAHKGDNDHPDILTTLRNIANIHTDQGSYDVANALFKVALTGYERRLGENHVETLKTVQFMAILLQKQCFYKEAEKMYSRAVIGYEKALGPRHPETIKIRSNLESLKSYFAKNPYGNFIVDSNFADK